MAGYFKAVAMDFDGTLTLDGELADSMLAAIEETRASGVRVILVTGRVLADLRSLVPRVEDHFDLVVAENGAVLAGPHGVRTLAPPVEATLAHALEYQGVSCHRGQVLIGCGAEHDVQVMGAIRRLGLDHQLVRNRGALMILPAGVSKGTGVQHALAALGISHHSAIAVGDAENDLALLNACELGVAVGNAVESLRSHADLVLDEPNGVGVIGLLRSALLRGELRLHSPRHRLLLGTGPDGAPVTIPASQLNVLIAGGTGSGKSYLAGLLAEQLIEQGYSVLVIDPEGDHTGLARLPGVLVAGGENRLPLPGELVRLLDHRFGSVVLDLSMLSPDEEAAYLAELPALVDAHRAATGLPHWVVIDEAHRPVGRDGAGGDLIERAQSGYCLVTWRPAELRSDVGAITDAVILLPGDPGEEDTLPDMAASFLGLGRHAVKALAGSLGAGQAALLHGGEEPAASTFTPGRRSTAHVRHVRKYAQAALPHHLRFYFHRATGEPTGVVAANLEEFSEQLAACDVATLRHHLHRGDFSSWIGGVLADSTLARRVSLIETADDGGDPVRGAETARDRILAAIGDRYLRRPSLRGPA